MALLSVKCPAAREGATPTTLTTQNENDIKGAPNGDHHDAKFDLRPKWPFWIGISGRENGGDKLVHGSGGISQLRAE